MSQATQIVDRLGPGRVHPLESLDGPPTVKYMFADRKVTKYGNRVRGLEHDQLHVSNKQPLDRAYVVIKCVNTSAALLIRPDVRFQKKISTLKPEISKLGLEQRVPFDDVNSCIPHRNTHITATYFATTPYIQMYSAQRVQPCRYAIQEAAVQWAMGHQDF